MDEEMQAIIIDGIKLVRLGDHVFVEVEMDGKWHKVIAEHHAAAFSHIVEPNEIRRIASE